MAASDSVKPLHETGETRRDFLFLAAGAFGAFAAGAAIWPFIDQMDPAADVLAASTTEVDLAPVAVGQRITVSWRGKPCSSTTVPRRRSRRRRA